jgi:hypothetical protein
MVERHGFAFSNEAKLYVHDRAGLGLKTGELAGGKCEFPGEECFNQPEPFVAHLTGCFEAYNTRFPRPEFEVFKDDPTGIRDVKQNALMQCREHNAFHDEQEKFQVESALAVQNKREFVVYEHKHKPKHRRSKSHGRRRGRR